jgi:monoamine oxidase
MKTEQTRVSLKQKLSEIFPDREEVPKTLVFARTWSRDSWTADLQI